MFQQPTGCNCELPRQHHEKQKKKGGKGVVIISNFIDEQLSQKLNNLPKAILYQISSLEHESPILGNLPYEPAQMDLATILT